MEEQQTEPLRGDAPRRMYPIQDGPSVPWEYMTPFESIAERNHSQTLTRLAERGGLGAAEAMLLVRGERLYRRPVEWDFLQLRNEWFDHAEEVNYRYSQIAMLEQSPLDNITRCVQLHEQVEIHYYVDHYAAILYTKNGDRSVIEGVGDDAASALKALDDELSKYTLEELRSL